MTDPIQSFIDARKLIDNAQSILIISHRNPDADAVGANLALREVLQSFGKNIDSACIDPIPESSKYLRESDSYISEINPKKYDLIITVDCGGHKLLGFHEKHPEILDLNQTKLINIDHHATNDHFGLVNIVMDSTPSTCFILYLFFTSFNWPITSSMATAMIHGIYFDTGSFMHSNTCPKTLRIAGRLLALGADHKRCIKEQFHTSSLNKLRLWGEALSRAELNEKNAVVSALMLKDFTETETKYEDAYGVVNYLSHIQEAKFCLFLAENTNGQIKGSLRTNRDDINVSEIAELFGGGGHTKAAGFTIEGKLKPKITWSIS